jgi:polysaccharide biosynthesis transport protein
VNFRSLFRFLRTSRLVIGVLALAGVGVAGGYVATQTPQYEATARAAIPTRQADLTEGATLVHQAAASYAEVATSPYVLNQVVRDMGLKETAEHLSGRVRAEARPGTTLIDITAADGSARAAAGIANDVTRRMTQAVGALTPATSSSESSLTLMQVEAAVAPTSPTSPNVLSTLVLGLLAGTAVGLLAAALRGRSGGGGDGGGVRRIPAPRLT